MKKKATSLDCKRAAISKDCFHELIHLVFYFLNDSRRKYFPPNISKTILKNGKSFKKWDSPHVEFSKGFINILAPQKKFPVRNLYFKINIIIFTLFALNQINAATFTVTNTNDSGTGSFRAAQVHIHIREVMHPLALLSTQITALLVQVPLAVFQIQYQ